MVMEEPYMDMVMEEPYIDMVMEEPYMDIVMENSLSLTLRMSRISMLISTWTCKFGGKFELKIGWKDRSGG